MKLRICIGIAVTGLAAAAMGGAAEDRWVFMPCNFWGKGADNPNSLEHFTNVVARAKAAGKTFSQMMRPISGVYANSGELNFRVTDKDAAIARALAVARDRLPPEISRSELDGIRVEYTEGWINIRKSNTEPYLRLLVECDTVERLHTWTALLKEAIGDES